MSDSRVGKLRGTHRGHVAKLTARGPLKIALSGVLKLCLVPERGEGRAGRVEGRGKCLLHFSFFVPYPKSLGVMEAESRGMQKSSVQGTHSAGDRQ